MNIARAAAKRSAVVGFAVMAGLGLATFPAHADGIQVDKGCATAAHTVHCVATVTGGTAPYQYAWAGFSNALVADTGTNHTQGICEVAGEYRVRLIVTDATGASVTTFAPGLCRNF